MMRGKGNKGKGGDGGGSASGAREANESRGGEGFSRGGGEGGKRGGGRNGLRGGGAQRGRNSNALEVGVEREGAVAKRQRRGGRVGVAAVPQRQRRGGRDGVAAVPQRQRRGGRDGVAAVPQRQRRGGRYCGGLGGALMAVAQSPDFEPWQYEDPRWERGLVLARNPIRPEDRTKLLKAAKKLRFYRPYILARVLYLREKLTKEFSVKLENELIKVSQYLLNIEGMRFIAYKHSASISVRYDKLLRSTHTAARRLFFTEPVPDEYYRKEKPQFFGELIPKNILRILASTLEIKLDDSDDVFQLFFD